MSTLNLEDVREHFPDEVSKKGLFEYFHLPWPPRKNMLLSVDHCQFVMEKRLEELDFVLSSTQGETPKDGNCMFHAILDQIRYNSRLADFADTDQELRWKIVNYGYDLYLRTNKLSWPNDPETGSPQEWKRRMLKLGVWGDEVVLTLASNILEVDIVIIPALRESSVHQGLGVQLIKAEKSQINDPPLFLFSFSETDFSDAHYQSIRPRSGQNVLMTFLATNQNDGDQLPVVAPDGVWDGIEIEQVELSEESLQNIQVIVSSNSER